MVSLKTVFITRKMKANEIMLKPLSRGSYKSILLKSRYVLDLPSPKQSGVSLRTYETLASGCTLITTSTTIAREQFYNDKQIIVVDAANLEQTVPNLLKAEPAKGENLSFEEYSLSSWVKKLFTIASRKNDTVNVQARKITS